MAKKLTVDPITRLEGHGKIEIFLDDSGNVERAYLQIPEFRGFEKFAVGRPVEEMPRITPRICGVCPTTHHMASSKATDAVYKVKPPVPGEKIRRMFNNMFMFEDHLLHFYYLGGPDFIVGPTAPKAERNILGVIGKVGLQVAGKLIGMRKEIRQLMEHLGGKVIHPVFSIPGGVAKGVDQDTAERLKTAADHAVEFAEFTIKAFHDIVLGNKEYVDLILNGPYITVTNYLGLVDENNKVEFYDGPVRVVDTKGSELYKFQPHEYLDYIAEHVEPWSWIKFPFLKKIGWKGFTEGDGTSIYRVAPLARLNVSDGMKTPKAQEEYEKMYETLGGKPVHHSLAFHWARVIEIMQAAEDFQRLANDPDILDPNIHTIPTETPSEGVGIVEAPRGTLIHHYKTDSNGIVEEANLIVATISNAPVMAMEIEKAAKAVIKNGKVDEGLLNMVEMAFRPYDPCHACATHSLPGQMPLKITIKRMSTGEVLDVITRD